MWFAGPARLVPEAGRPAALRTGFVLKPGMRVGLYGGSFNPVHEGHLHVARTAITRLNLDRVIWLVSPQNPLKSSKDTAPLKQRLADVTRAIGDSRMIVSDIETRLGSQFTIDTLRLLKARYPGVHFVWIMGADSLKDVHRWRGWTQLMREVPVAVVSRPWASLKARLSPAARRFARYRHPAREAPLLATLKAPAWVYLRGPFNFASSTAMRERMRAKP
ncbi:nicotinate-nucleotide adenylyltransferase [Caulobacter sp. NIBR1757]|uniref:nicotinate-nucleotide adenylyltransferase n=1 Tax=Caulobacter sp. NIBR1757 TaxID=3016000 RepID=UPI0022F06B47|nr:nicotinate-nucleotide adenylyltransferase [Caulobacter sp. NIBR1757]WGM40845.1 nicotinate-nucleotide adenylyltransferase [Caulobacter sp. NIBR1757]